MSPLLMALDAHHHKCAAGVCLNDEQWDERLAIVGAAEKVAEQADAFFRAQARSSDDAMMRRLAIVLWRLSKEQIVCILRLIWTT